jgi:hypothetical protein
MKKAHDDMIQALSDTLSNWILYKL